MIVNELMDWANWNGEETPEYGPFCEMGFQTQ